MKAGPLSNAKVISLLNRYFVPVYAVNEDYRRGGVKPAEEKAEYQRIYREALKAHLSTGTVHVYILAPDGRPIASLHVATASRVENLVGLLEQTRDRLKIPEGKPLVKPAPQSAAPPAPAGSLVLHLTSRYLGRRGNELVPLTREVHLGEDRHGSWAALPSENWIVLSPKDISRFLPAPLRAGVSSQVDPQAAEKVLTYFYPQTENNDVSTNRFDKLELRAMVLSLKDGVARVRLDGSLRMKHPFYHRDDDSFVEATLVGFMEVEVARKQIKSFRLVTDQATYRHLPFGVVVRNVP